MCLDNCDGFGQYGSSIRKHHFDRLFPSIVADRHLLIAIAFMQDVNEAGASSLPFPRQRRE